MRAFQVRSTGQAPILTEVPVPDPGPGQVRVKIAACGLNFADLLMVKGTYQDMPPAPFALGMEAAGVVDAVGGGDVPAPGTRVAVLGGHGGLAEYGVSAAARCVPIPDAMPFEAAAGFTIAHGTSHLALTRRARLKAGERLLEMRRAA